MKSAIVSLMRMAVGFMLIAPSSHAAVIYQTGDWQVAAGGNLSVPITVSSTLAPPSTYWGNASFNLVWNASVLTLQSTPVDVTGTPLPLGLGNFGTGTSGQLNFSWLDLSGTGSQVPNGSTLFTVNFTAIGAVGSSTALSFQSIANIGLTDSLGNNATSVIPTGDPGTITVVPEPVNYALGLFAVIFLGAATRRWISSRRTPLRPLI